MARERIAIVGGGLVGSLWAVLMSQKGYSVDVFEKRSDPRLNKADQGRSINLVITSRGLYGLERAGLLKKALSLAVPVYGRMIHSTEGEPLFQPYGRNDECNYSISRGVLNCFLLNEAERLGARIHFEHSVETFDFERRQLVFIGQEGGYTYDRLFGTDGAGSSVRRALISEFPSQFSDSIEWLEADYKELVMPLRADGRPALNVKGLHIWPRRTHMLMALANQDGTFTLTLYLPRRGKKSFETMGTKDAVLGLFQSDFASALEFIPDVAEQFLKNPQGALGTVRCPRWVWGNSVALMGDAAHAVVPFFGQGMNCGFEDCTVLLDILDKPPEDWTGVFQEYERRRLPNANAIADMAIENWTEMRDRVADPEFQKAKRIEAWLEKEFPEKFKSRYGMITYTLIPYAEAKEAGQIHQKIVRTLALKGDDPEAWERTAAERLLDQEFLPFLRSKEIQLRSYVSESEGPVGRAPI